MKKTTILLLLAALLVPAQTPVPHPIGECGFVDPMMGITPKSDSLEPDYYAIPRGDFCEKYTYEAGWEKTMKLYLGEGAEDYRELIELAVKKWNEVLHYPSYLTNPPANEPLIEIVDERPRKYRLSNWFWRNIESRSSDNADDNQSVIYFKASGESQAGLRGYSRVRVRGDQLIEADTYINTFSEEEYGPDLALTKLITHYRMFGDNDSVPTAGAYAMVNATYVVILHELGHAIGLQHIPVKGNVMSRDFMPALRNQWLATAVASHYDREVENFSFYRNNVDAFPMPLFFQLSENVSPYFIFQEWQRELVEFFTLHAQLGEQEKMALMCNYEY